MDASIVSDLFSLLVVNDRLLVCLIQRRFGLETRSADQLLNDKHLGRMAPGIQYGPWLKVLQPYT